MFSSIQAAECVRIVLFAFSCHVKFYIDFIASLQRILVTSIGPLWLNTLKIFTVDYSCYFLMFDRNSVLGNSMPLTSIKQRNNQKKIKQPFNYVVCWLGWKKICFRHSSRSIRRLYFTDLLQAKTCSKRKNLSLSYILDVLLKFRKFQAQYSCEVYFYVKREISATNHVVCKVLGVIALAASGFKSI